MALRILQTVAFTILLCASVVSGESPLTIFLRDDVHRWFALAMERLGVQYDNDSSITLLLPEPKNSKVSEAWAKRVPFYAMGDLEDLVLAYVLPRVYPTPEALAEAGLVTTAAGTLVMVRMVEGQIRVKLFGSGGVSVFTAVPEPIARGKVVIYLMHKVVPEYEKELRREGTILSTGHCHTTFCVGLRNGLMLEGGQPVDSLLLRVPWQDSSHWRKGSSPGQRLAGQQVVAGETRCWDLSKAMGKGHFQLEVSTTAGGGRQEVRDILWETPNEVGVFRNEHFFGNWAWAAWKSNDEECSSQPGVGQQLQATHNWHVHVAAAPVTFRSTR